MAKKEDTFDPESLRMDPSLVGVAKPKQPKRIKGPFLRGPISMEWFAKASKCRALWVGSVLWHLCGLNHFELQVRLSNVTAKKWGISRAAKDRALNALERRGLIKVDRKRGRSPLITLVCTPGNSPKEIRARTGAIKVN